MSLATLDPHHKFVSPKALLVGFFKSVVSWLVFVVEAQSRSEEYARLNAKTDEELEAMGLTRETIVQHVFADRMWL